jgi:hypothetical protein
MSLRNKIGRLWQTLFTFPNPYRRFHGVIAPRRAMLETKQKIFKKLKTRINEEFDTNNEDCFCR